VTLGFALVDVGGVHPAPKLQAYDVASGVTSELQVPVVPTQSSVPLLGVNTGAADTACWQTPME
jgi:hypothetical protein